MNRTVAVVAVEKTFFNLSSDYDYYVPTELEKVIDVGMIVSVPFGNANCLREGIVVKLYTAINSKLKEIAAIKDSMPVIRKEMLDKFNNSKLKD